MPSKAYLPPISSTHAVKGIRAEVSKNDGVVEVSQREFGEEAEHYLHELREERLAAEERRQA
jgi:hypothetical protein